MSELRQDPTTGAFVIIAPERAHRPGAQAAPPVRPAERVPRYDKRCPFCPGNEAQLPGILAETPAKDPPGWAVRVVPNKFAALAPDEPRPAHADGGHTIFPGYGFHEVIIESPHHDADPSTMETEEIAAAVACYQSRFIELSRSPGIEAVIVFRNRGAKSGASLIHPHAQVLALPIVPPKLRALSNWAALRGRETGACPTCAELEREMKLKERIVEESRSFVALVPFAAEHPCEQWLVPKRHHASFGATTEEELADLAGLLARSLKRLKTARGDPPSNFAVESAGPLGADAPYLHWRLRIVPEILNSGGFERSSGMAINPSAPAADAGLLRKSLREEREAKT